MKISKHQMTVLETLYDVATHEGGGIILKNRYHSPAHALIRKGYVRRVDRFPYRPHYYITEEGMAAYYHPADVKPQSPRKGKNDKA